MKEDEKTNVDERYSKEATINWMNKERQTAYGGPDFWKSLGYEFLSMAKAAFDVSIKGKDLKQSEQFKMYNKFLNQDVNRIRLSDKNWKSKQSIFMRHAGYGVKGMIKDDNRNSRKSKESKM